jgi:hypothetical protein
MEIETVFGLDTAVVTVDEALRTDWVAHRDKIDVVRVVNPEPASWQALRRAGFAIMPPYVTWTAPMSESEAAFIAGLSVKERRNFELGLRFVAEHKIRLAVIAPIDIESFDAFLDLYNRQIDSMRHGVPFAHQQRADILAKPDDYFLVQALQGETLVGCCVCMKRSDAATVIIRFATSTPESRKGCIVRAMYLKAFEKARDLGCRDLSLGTDPALYGHIAKPGLFRFKSRLGFIPIPARIYGTYDDPDEAGRVLSLDTLSEPSLLLSYHLPADGTIEAITDGTPLRLDVLTRSPDTEIDLYRAAFLGDVGIQNVP